MEYREIAPEEDVPVLGLGTWGIGGRQIEDHRWDDEAVMAIRMAVELGMTHIDTAEYYGAGHSEELVGEAIQYYPRKDLFITTKVWRTHLREEDLLESIVSSLKRLRLDYVDLFLIHWPSPNVPLQETVKAMERCVDEGFTRYIGVSNFSASLMKEAQNYTRTHRFIANQVDYSLMDQKPKMELLPYMRETGTTLISYRPLARGTLAKPGNRVLDDLSMKYQKSQAQIALNWLINQENVVTIPKSTSPVHLLDNIGAVGWRLALDDELALADSFI